MESFLGSVTSETAFGGGSLWMVERPDGRTKSMSGILLDSLCCFQTW